MKKIYSILLLSILLASCGEQKKNSVEKVLESDNLETIRKKRGELVNEQDAINEKIKLLDEKIATLDTVQHVPLITTITAKTEEFKHILELQGNVTTKDLLVITPEYNGILTNVYVKEGQQVSKGQTLAKIDDGGLSQQLAQLKIQADLAKTTYERQKRLWDQNIGSEIQYLQAKSTYESQQEAVNQMQQQIAKTVVKAPFSGTIDDVITEQGSVVAAGASPLMRIVNLNNMYIETEVPERYVTDVVKNKDVVVELPVLNKKIDTKIRQAGDVINPANRTFKVEIEVPNKDKSIKPNLTAKLKINDYTNKEAILIPQSVISENAEGEQYVYVVTNKNEKGIGNAKRVIIETGKTQGDVIEILNGLETGAEIIKEGARSVRDGQSVEVINYKEEGNGK
ncbi:MAG: efflux transporter periplasmic adaptor subunit [Flavobacteriaceae bacterium]|uniref:efflux RND transporter periplasmic adaptor subunit n=1 Tax=Winogradskyella poriferorum TaxID=307627 RepID=UPI000C3ED5BA|nr:efflux transporter periplasmic adaptor subunit [Flavobacteriaceae bacterium]MBD10181.1 efflux transporter periplasmic adaptor subunit [Flavobacteriaceae bacterium]|tara:strand:+ start:10961 stop:12151 length:1191 start_codon:yes stop_codon:yes gene_type:complete